MASLAKLFTGFNRIALIGWLLLFFAPLAIPLLAKANLAWLTLNNLVISIILLQCVFYTFVLFNKKLDQAGDHPKGSFFSLRGVTKLFQHPRAVLTGWIHFLAFDLFVGLFIFNHSQNYDINHLWLVAPLFFTLMFGPLGLLMYSVVGFILIEGFVLF